MWPRCRRRVALPRSRTPGSCGSETFGLFQRIVADRTDVRVRCFVNLSRLGMTGISAAGELANAAYSDPAGTLRILREQPEVARGVKVRLSREVTGGPGMAFLRAARRVAADANVPLCVHIGNSVEPMAEILAELAAGDMVTHYQTPKPNGLLDRDRVLLPEALLARQRGILFDSGHGMTHFDFDVAAALLEQDFPPDILSTDISRNSFRDLAPGLLTVMNKWLALGLGLPEVVAATTTMPSAALKENADCGTLAVARPADIAVLTINEGRFVFADAGGRQRIGELRLEPYLTMKDGRIVWDSRRPGVVGREGATCTSA